MVKTLDDVVFDAALNKIKNDADNIVVCIGAPANYTEATTNYPTGKRSGTKAITGSDFAGPTNGDTNGRKLTVNQITGITCDVSGTADHVAIVDNGASVLLLVTSLSASQAVTAGNSMTVNSFKLEMADPT